jgi:hypothetical protein
MAKIFLISAIASLPIVLVVVIVVVLGHETTLAKAFPRGEEGVNGGSNQCCACAQAIENEGRPRGRFGTELLP